MKSFTYIPFEGPIVSLMPRRFDQFSAANHPTCRHTHQSAHMSAHQNASIWGILDGIHLSIQWSTCILSIAIPIPWGLKHVATAACITAVESGDGSVSRRFHSMICQIDILSSTSQAGVVLNLGAMLFGSCCDWVWNPRQLRRLY